MTTAGLDETPAPNSPAQRNLPAEPSSRVGPSSMVDPGHPAEPTFPAESRPAVRGFPDIGRCRVLGVVNVTPDSFSDGGAYLDVESAVRHGLALAGTGADLVDVGGESTRPGAARVPEAEERSRVLPVVRELATAGVAVSVDTCRAAVAAAALAAGAALVNDVSGGLADPAMAGLVAEAGVPYVVMHSRGPSVDMQLRATYADVVADVVAELHARVAALLGAGVAAEQLILDPGLGFAKTAAHNWGLLGGIGALRALGRPLLVGASRKAFLGQLLSAGGSEPASVGRRDGATAAVTVLAAQAGAWGVRVHDVAPSADAVRVVSAVLAAGRRSSSTTPGSGLDRPRPALDADRLALRGLRLSGRHGVLAVERERAQEFVVDVALSLDTRPAAHADALAATVDYAALAERLSAVVGGPSVELIETLADRLAEVCLADPRVSAAEVTVHKPAAPLGVAFDDVSVTVDRRRVR